MRDDFSSKTKEILAKRVGWKCSNPNCRRLTSGPQLDVNKAINIGVAAHITAASPGGPRYDSSLTREQRQSIENGIWLCQTCSKLIDNDDLRYTVERLNEWKESSEEHARLALENLVSMGKTKIQSDLQEIYENTLFRSTDVLTNISVYISRCLHVIRGIIRTSERQEFHKTQNHYSEFDSLMTEFSDLLYGYHNTFLESYSVQIKDLQESANRYGAAISNPNSPNDERAHSLEALIEALENFGKEILPEGYSPELEFEIYQKLFSLLIEAEKSMRQFIRLVQKEDKKIAQRKLDSYVNHIQNISDVIYVHKDTCLKNLPVFMALEERNNSFFAVLNDPNKPNEYST